MSWQEHLKKMSTLAARATPGRWMLWTSCSWRRIGTEDQLTTVLQPTVSRSDGHPDMSGEKDDFSYIIEAKNSEPIMRKFVEQLVELVKWEARVSADKKIELAWDRAMNDVREEDDARRNRQVG